MAIDKLERVARISEMCSLREAGLTLQQIAERFGMTRERVRQLIKKNGGPVARVAREKRRVSQAQNLQAERDRVKSEVLENPGITLSDVAARLEVTVAKVRQLLTPELKMLLLPAPRDKSKKWESADVLSALRRASLYSFPLTATTYSRLVRLGEVNGPSLPLIYQRFRTWKNACDQAGVECGESNVPAYASNWTDSDLLAFVADYLRQPGSSGTFYGYELWRLSAGDTAPSGQTLRNRLGTWREIRGLAIKEMLENKKNKTGN